jgi:hypothetical protein
MGYSLERVLKPLKILTVILTLLLAFWLIDWLLPIIRNPTRNVTHLHILALWIPLTLLAASAVFIYMAESLDKTPQEDSDDQERSGMYLSRVFRRLAEEKVLLLFVFIILFWSSSTGLVFDGATYEEFNGGEITCHVPNPTYKSNIQEDEVVNFSSLNEMDRMIFRMAINSSYLTSTRDGLNETAEYDLLVTRDEGYESIVLYEGEVGGSTHFPPPEGILDEPTMDINGSEYFTGGFRERPNVRYRNGTYWCLMDEFYIKGA